MLLSLDGVWHHAGWQWVFIVTGVLALVLAPIVLFYLPRSVETASFLTPQERSRLARMVADEAPAAHHEGSLWTVLWDCRVLAFSLGYTLLLTSLYGLIYWLPTVIKGFGVSSSMNGLLTLIPWALTAALLLIVPRLLTKERHVRVAAAAIGMIGCVAFVVSLLVSDPSLRYLALVVGTPCTSLLLPCFWSLPSKYFSGKRSAASLAIISSIGNFGGFLAQNAMPWIGKTLGHPRLRDAAAGAVPAAARLHRTRDAVQQRSRAAQSCRVLIRRFPSAFVHVHFYATPHRTPDRHFR